MQAGVGRSEQERASRLRPVPGRGLCLSPPSSAGCSLLTLAAWFQLTTAFLPPQGPYPSSRLHFAVFLAHPDTLILSTRLAHTSPVPATLHSPVPLSCLSFVGSLSHPFTSFPVPRAWKHPFPISKILPHDKSSASFPFILGSSPSWAFKQIHSPPPLVSFCIHLHKAAGLFPAHSYDQL